MGRVVSVNISEKKGTVKKPVEEISLKIRHGILGDAHAGDWHRQISLLAEESVDKLRPLLPDLPPGAFAENVNTEGVDLSAACGNPSAAGGNRGGGDADWEGMPQ